MKSVTNPSERSAKFISVSSTDNLFTMMLKDRFDAFITDAVSLSHFIKGQNLDPSSIHYSKIDILIDQSDPRSYVLFTRYFNQDFVNQFNAAMRAFASGDDEHNKLKQLFYHYFDKETADLIYTQPTEAPAMK